MSHCSIISPPVIPAIHNFISALQHSSGGSRKKCIGVIISLSELKKGDIRHFQSFIFSHFTLIDGHLERLRIGVDEACSSKNLGVGGRGYCYEGLRDFLGGFSVALSSTEDRGMCLLEVFL